MPCIAKTAAAMLQRATWQAGSRHGLQQQRAATARRTCLPCVRGTHPPLPARLESLCCVFCCAFFHFFQSCPQLSPDRRRHTHLLPQHQDRTPAKYPAIRPRNPRCPMRPSFSLSPLALLSLCPCSFPVLCLSAVRPLPRQKQTVSGVRIA